LLGSLKLSLELLLPGPDVGMTHCLEGAVPCSRVQPVGVDLREWTRISGAVLSRMSHPEAPARGLNYAVPRSCILSGIHLHAHVHVQDVL
jgi:hypothetical protein